jgi:hypothetical protein
MNGDTRPRGRRAGTRLRGWRKIATASWGRPVDPQIYGDLEIDAGALQAYASRVRHDTGVRVTVTHLVGRGLAHAFAENPDLNGRLWRGRFHQRDSVDIFFIVTADDGRELSGVKVEHADRKSVVTVAQELAERSARIRSGADEEFGRTKTLLERVPPRPLALGLRFAAWLSVDLDRDVPRLGIRRQSFGSALVTSVGMLGIQHGYAPLSPYYRVPLLILVGEVTPRPVVVAGSIEIRPMLGLSATLDHRYLDGFHAARLARSMRAYCADPARYEQALGEPGQPVSGD